MNNLSWLLYWADVAPQVSSAICFISFILTAVFMFCWFGSIVDDSMDDDMKRTFRRFVWVWPFLIVLYITTWLVPGDKETYYAIAASEVGEEILETPEIGKAREALNRWLDKQLTEEPETENGS